MDDAASTDPMNPVSLEHALHRVRDAITRGVPHVSAAHREASDTARAYDRAYARAFLGHEGPQTEKRYAAEIHPDVIVARDRRDVAELAYRHARRVAESLRDELSALQSIGRSLTSMFSSETGVGR